MAYPKTVSYNLNLMKPFFYTILILIGLQSCSYPVVENQAPEVNNLKVGKRFTIKLPENHSLNESWLLKSDYNHLLVEDLGAVWHGNEKGVYFNLNTLSSGTCELSFIKRKYQDTVESRHYLLHVVEN